MKNFKRISMLIMALVILCALFACGDGVRVSFESDGGTTVPAVTLNAGDVLEAPENPTREGYSFAGWKTVSGELWNFTSPVTQDVTLVASWIKDEGADKATVSFDLKGGDTANYPMSAVVVKGSVFAEPAAPVRAGYAFSGWLYLGEKYDFENNVVAGDITLVASWTPVVYKLSYDLAGGEIEAPVAEYTTEAEAVVPNPKRPGYKFLGWIYEGVGAPVPSLVLTKGTVGDLKLTACWEIVEYTISYDFGGAEAPETVYASYNVESESFSVAPVSKEYYDFLGWQINGEGEPVANLTVETGTYGNLSLTAIFKPHEYAIEYELGDESAVNNEKNPLFTTVESEEFKLLAPTRTGYKLLGWQIGGEGETLAEAVVPAGITEGLKYTAVWEKESYTVTYFDYNGKVRVGEALVHNFSIDDVSGGKSLKLPTLYLNNKCFISWYADVDLTTPITEITECKNISVYAKFVDVSDGLLFTYNGKSYDVTGYTGEDSVVYIPELYKNVLVTSVGSGVFEGSKISEIYLPISIEKIGEKAFFRAENLKKINLNEKTALTEIGRFAFSGSTLESFEAPKSLKVIGEGAFLGCTSFKSVSLKNSALETIAASAFEGTVFEEIALPETLKSIGDGAFLNNTKLKSVSFGENSNLLEILNEAFKNCAALGEISIPKSVSTIGDSAFENCEALSSIKFDEDSALTAIGKSSFRNCDSLVSVSFPKNLTEISEYAFYSNDSLIFAGFVTEGALVKIGKFAFAEAPIKSIAFPENLAAIEEGAFDACTSLVAISFNEKLANIAALAFNSCSSIKEIVLPAGCFAEADAFKGASSLEKLVINKVNPAEAFGGKLPAGIKEVVLLNEESIAAGIFAGCVSLEKVTVPFVGVSKIGTSAEEVKTFVALFDGQLPESLKTVIVTGGTYVSDGAFLDCAYIETIILPRTTEFIGMGAFSGCISLSYLELPMAITQSPQDLNKTFAYVFGEAVPKSLTKATVFSYGEDKEGVLPEGIFVGSYVKELTLVGFKNISDSAFRGVKTLVRLDTTKSAIVEIGNEAFAGCTALTSFTVPKTVKTVGKMAFSESGLTKISFEADSQLEKIGSAAFSDCASLRDVALPNGITKIEANLFCGSLQLKSIALPDTVTSIGESAFEDCTSLAELILGEASKLSEIGKEAFKNSGLASFTVPFAVKEIKDGVFENCFALTVFEFMLPSEADTIPEIYVIGAGAFRNSAIVSINLPAYVTRIQESAFEGCTALESVSFGEASKLSNIGARAFADCKKLKSIAIPDGITAIANETFKDCSSLASVEFGEKSQITEILARAFENCLSLEKIVIPDSVTTLGDYVFANCFALSEIKLPARVSVTVGEGESAIVTTTEAKLHTIGEGAFKNCDSLVEIALPASLTSLGELAFYNCDKLSAVKFEDGAQLSKICASLFLNCTSLKSFAVPDSVNVIENGAFRNCAALESVSLGEKSALQSIGVCAFMNCTALKSFKACEALESIGTEAFKGCAALTDVQISTNVQSISNYAFKDTPNLVIIVYYFAKGEESQWLNSAGLAPYWNTDNNEVEFVFVEKA